MPPKVPDREKQIGRRLQTARRRMALTQTDFALKIGIGRERLASYEAGRVPLPWTVGDRMCDLFDINPAWLVEGTEPSEFYLKPEGVDWKTVPPRALFSEVFDQHLSPFYQRVRSGQDTYQLLARLTPAEEEKLRKQIGPRRSQFKLLVERLLPLFDDTNSREDKWELVNSLASVVGKATLRSMRAKQTHQQPPSPREG